jgi:hypothetical protein
MAEIRTRETQHGGGSVRISKEQTSAPSIPPQNPQPQPMMPKPDIPTQQRPAPPAPKAQDTVTEKARLVSLVANRLGWVSTDDPEEAMTILTEEAKKMNENVYKYLESLARLGRTVCHAETPDCVKCPMMEGCKYASNHNTGKKMGLFRRK